MSSDPPPLPPNAPPPLPPSGETPPPSGPSAGGQLLIGAALAIVTGGIAFALGAWPFGLFGIPVIGALMAAFDRTRRYGLGILISYGIAALIALSVCGFIFFGHMR